MKLDLERPKLTPNADRAEARIEQLRVESFNTEVTLAVTVRLAG